MSIEKLAGFQADPRRLADELTDLLRRAPVKSPTDDSDDFLMGWPILNATGDTTSGIPSWYQCLDVDGSFNPEKALALKYRHEFEHDKKTPFCRGYFEDIIDQIVEMGLQPRRARVTLIRAGKSLPWHTDAPPENYLVRLHVPLRTNLKCLFRFESGSYHLPADGGAWILPVNQHHEFRNDGDTDRFHLIMSIYDTRGITQFNRCEPHHFQKILSDRSWLNSELKKVRS